MSSNVMAAESTRRSDLRDLLWRMCRNGRSTLPSVGGIATVVMLYSVARQVSPHLAILPGVDEIIQDLFAHRDRYFSHALSTTQSAAMGLLWGGGSGFLLGCVAGMSGRIYMFLAPIAVWLKATPIVALSPFLLILLFQSETQLPGIAAAAVCFFPIFMNVTHGLRDRDAAQMEYFLSLEPRWWQLLRYILLPRAIGYAASGVKSASTMAVVGATVGEFIGPRQGVGFLVIQAQQYTDFSMLMNSIVLSGFIGVMFYLAASAILGLVSRHLGIRQQLED